MQRKSERQKENCDDRRPRAERCERRGGVDDCGDTSKMRRSLLNLSTSFCPALFLRHNSPSWVKATGSSTSPSTAICASLKRPHRTPRRLTSQVFVNQNVYHGRGSFAESNHQVHQASVKLSASGHSRQLHAIRTAAVSCFRKHCLLHDRCFSCCNPLIF